MVFYHVWYCDFVSIHLAEREASDQLRDLVTAKQLSLDLKDVNVNCDVLDWDYKQYPSLYFDFIWASRPCIEYFIARTGS